MKDNPLAHPLWIKEWEKIKARKKMLTREPKYGKLLLWAQNNNLDITKLGEYQYRVKNTNTGKFVDWWDGKKKTLRKIDGSFEYHNDVDDIGEELVKLLREEVNI